VIVDDRALNQRAVQMLAAILARQDGDHPTVTPPSPSLGGGSVLAQSRASLAGSYLGGDGDGGVRRRRAMAR
jgi:hypothetical protein